MSDLTLQVRPPAPLPIEFDEKPLLEAIRAIVEPYETIVYSEDQLREAMKDRAKLTKLSTKLLEVRRYVKKKCLEEYDKFEPKINRLIEVVDPARQNMGVFINGVEAKFKSEKRDKCRAIYEEEIGQIKEIIPFERIENTRWQNKTFEYSAIIKEIKELAEKIKKDWQVIKNLKSPYTIELMYKYAERLDLGDVLAREKELREGAEAVKQIDEERAEEPVIEAEPQEKLFRGFYQIIATDDGHKELKKWAAENGFQLKRLSKNNINIVEILKG